MKKTLFSRPRRERPRRRAARERGGGRCDLGSRTEKRSGEPEGGCGSWALEDPGEGPPGHQAPLLPPLGTQRSGESQRGQHAASTRPSWSPASLASSGGRALRPFCEELQRKCGTTNELGHFKGDCLFQVQTCGDTVNEKGVFHRRAEDGSTNASAPHAEPAACARRHSPAAVGRPLRGEGPGFEK